MSEALSAEDSVSARKVHEFFLDNGLQVIVIPDHRAPVATQMLWYKVGSADDPKGISGLAHFVEHLMFKGTEANPPGQFAKVVARNGGEFNAFTRNDVTAYFERVARDRLPTVMALEADRMSNLRFSDDEVKSERNVVLEERRSRVENAPNAILQERMMAALFPGHPYGIPVIGWYEEIEGFSPEAAVAFYKRYYAPNNAVLVIAGDVTPDEVRKLAEENFGSIPASETLEPVRVRPVTAAPSEPVVIQLADPRAGRITVQRYFPVPSYPSAKPGEAEALDLMMRIVTGGAAGKLYRRLVVEEKLAATAGGGYVRPLRDAGMLAFDAIAAEGVTAEQLEEAMTRFIAELRQGSVTQADLDRAKSSYLAQFVYAADSQDELAGHYGGFLSAGLTLDQIEAWPARIDEVTVADIEKVAATYLDPARSVTGILEPSAESLAA
ncbi:PqqF [Methyloligella halotolerans]|uniref:PqqF n=1 Tax=Methyloligella halotolerans TaxID=1177755 RepID=A0A1E2RYA0_9HYPH|nr:pitrilysin family protein [Methyloligella halotolerans]ODA67207.1 PqqF [Methyloligella halotolerans]